MKICKIEKANHYEKLEREEIDELVTRMGQHFIS